MNEVIQYFKIILVIAVRFVLHIFWVFPIRRNRIVFSSHWKTYNCNPKYICESLKEKYGNKLSYIWIGRNCDVNIPLLTFVRHKSMASIFFMTTGGLIFFNDSFPSWIPLRKTQVLINTWHGGGAYKDIGSSSNVGCYNSFVTRITAKNVKYFISSSYKFSRTISKALLIDSNKFLPFGMPRNDIFFSKTINKANIKNKVGLLETDSVILYAPTFRGVPKSRYCINNIDLKSVASVAKYKFKKKFVVLHRYHHTISDNAMGVGNIIDVTSYPDMQELLYITDILITDYSSSIWDYSLMFKPCFLFTPDIQDYSERQGFVTPVEEWPFPNATDNMKLCQLIRDYNESDSIRRISKHHSVFGSYESGSATTKITDMVDEIICKK